MPGLLSGSWIDLDGDGSKEQVFFRLAMEDEEIGTATLTVKGGSAGGETSVSLEVCNPHYRCYASSMDGTHTRLVVAGNGMSADPMLEFYAYGQGSLQGMGQIAARVENLEIFPDYMTARVETWHLQNQPLELKYVVENGRIVWQEQGYYEYQGNSAKAMAQIPLYGEKNGGDITVTLEAEDQVQVVGGDLKEWVLLKKESTGESGWLKVIGGDCYLPDGTVEMSSLLFEGLPFYG